jgi:hypothetical protein
MVNLVPCEVSLLIGSPLNGHSIGCPGLNDIREEEDTTSENESPKCLRGTGCRKNVRHGIPPVTIEGSIPALFSSFGNPAIRIF